MAVPIVAFPESFHRFSELMVSMIHPEGIGAIGSYFSITGPLIGIGYGLVFIGHVWLGFRNREGTGSWEIDVAETILLVVYFAIVPVVIAVGLYFPLWYSARQIARELSVDKSPTTQTDILGCPETDPTSVALRAWFVLIAGAPPRHLSLLYSGLPFRIRFRVGQCNLAESRSGVCLSA